MPTLEKVDVVIMGAGAAGSLLAARLAGAGRKVVVLDAGPPWTLADLTSSQIWARRLKWGGSAVARGGRDPIGHNMATGWGFGGAALHHYAGWPRMHPADFTMRSDHGRGLDWPIGYEDLRPYYDRVQAEMGVSGDVAAEKWRPPGAPYPMPPLKWFAQGEILKRGFEKRGMHVAPHPMAVTSVEWKGRPACQYDGWCDAGCPILALANPLVLHQPAAERAGATFRAHATVTGLMIDRAGRAEGLHYVDGEGVRHAQPADIVVLAGAAVQNARLLLASRHARHRRGFGNASGLVGRWFNVHSLANAHGLFEQETECHRGLSAGTLMSQDGYGKASKGEAFGSVTWGIAPAVKPNDLLGIAMTRPDLFGPELDAFMKRAAKHLGVINGIVEGMPMAENRVELTRTRDRFGVPDARVVHGMAPESRALWAKATEEGLEIMRAAGAGEAWATPVPVFSHVSGGTIMGADPAASVCDDLGRVHGSPNVVVAGGGLFPTIGAVSPTFTVLALSERTAESMTADRGAFPAS